jgi:hypothetical protein
MAVEALDALCGAKAAAETARAAKRTDFIVSVFIQKMTTVIIFRGSFHRSCRLPTALWSTLSSSLRTANWKRRSFTSLVQHPKGGGEMTDARLLGGVKQGQSPSRHLHPPSLLYMYCTILYMYSTVVLVQVSSYFSGTPHAPVSLLICKLGDNAYRRN